MKRNLDTTRSRPQTLSNSELATIKGGGLFSDVIDTLSRWVSSTSPDGGKVTTTGREGERQAADTSTSTVPPK